MAWDAHDNFGKGTLTNAPGTSGTSFILGTGEGANFSVNQPVTIAPPNVQPDASNAEIGYVTAVSTDTLTVTRAQQGTSAINAAIGDMVYGTITTKALTDIENEVDLKAPLASPTFTGTVSGITKSMVGLGNVDNTSDANKPISTATQTALDAKVAGPASATDNAIARFDGTTGKLVQDSLITASDTGALNVNTGSATGELNIGQYAKIESRLNIDSEQSNTLTSTESVDIQLGSGGYFNVYNSSGSAVFYVTSAGVGYLYGIPVVTTIDTQTLTNKTLSTGSVIDANVTVTEVLKKVYPVGSIYIATVSTNPNTLFGFGTWAAYAEGRVLVGKAASGTFGTAGATGGAETHTLTESEMPSHTHGAGTLVTASDGAHTHSIKGSNSGTAGYAAATRRVDDSSGNIANGANSSGAHTHTISGSTASTGSGSAHNNLQPYIVVYMWHRTA